MSSNQILSDEISFKQIQNLGLNNICYQLTTRGKWPFKGNFNSTSFFIHKNLLLTSAHNVVKTYRNVNRIVIAPSRIGNEYHFGKFEFNNISSENIIVFPQYDMKNKSSRALYDIALIYLPNKVLDKNPEFSFNNNLPILNSVSSLKVGEEVYCAGYPASGDHTNRFRMTLDKSKVEDIQEDTFKHKLKTATGNSGSPIMVKRNDKFYIIGVNSIKYQATLINDSKMTWITEQKNKLFK